MVAGLDQIDEEDDDNWDDDSQDDEERTLVEHRHEHLAVSHIRRKQMAPKAFSKLPSGTTEEYVNKSKVLLTLKDELQEQNSEVLTSIPQGLEKFAELLTSRTTSILLGQKHLGLDRYVEFSIAQKALQEAR